MENLKADTEITLTFPSNLIIIPRLVISGLLSNEKITLEEIENTKLIISEALNLVIDKNKTNYITIKFILIKKEELISLNANISTILTKQLLENLSQAGLTIHILNYLCSTFFIKQTTDSIEIFLKKEIRNLC